MPSNRLHRYYRGILLPFIARDISGLKQPPRKLQDRLHKEFKCAFGVESTASLTNKQMQRYLSQIVMVMARERGLICPAPGDTKQDLENMTMDEFLQQSGYYDQ